MPEDDLKTEPTPGEQGVEKNEQNPSPGEQDTHEGAPKSLLEAVEQSLKTDDEGIHEKQGEKEQEAPAAKAKDQQGDNEQNKGKEGDEVEIPDDIQAPKSRERFREMATSIKQFDEENKQLKAELEPLKQDHAGFTEILQYSQATPEEFNQLMNYSHLLKTGDLDGAFAIVEQQYMQLSRLMGKSVSDPSGKQPYEEHDDLAEAVDNMDVTAEWANKIAGARNKENLGKQQTQQRQANQERTQQQETNYNKAVEEGQAKIVALGKKWAASDIDYQAKHQKLFDAIPTIVEKYPPNLWETALTDYYNTLSSLKVKPDTTETPAPLRSGGGGSGTREPNSVLDAINQGLDSLR